LKKGEINMAKKEERFEVTFRDGRMKEFAKSL